MGPSALIFIGITVITVFGDYFIKTSSAKPEGLTSLAFLFGAILYGLPAIGWFFLMKSHSLAMLGAFYSASTIIILASLGYFVFKEAFGMREMLGISLSISAVLVMSQE
jgi:drug/metabolite transporter (DMT)-like permease